MSEEANRISLKGLIAPHFWGTFKSKITHQVDMGGRGSTKTSKNALKVVYHCLKESSCSAVIIRRYQNTLRNSVFKEIKKACSRYSLEENTDYTSKVSPFEIKFTDSDNTIYFAGGDDYEKLKGMIDEKNPIKIIWFEELTEFDSADEIDQIVATFSRGNDDWFIVLYSYNPPKNKFNWVNEWAKSMEGRSDCIVTRSDYRTVPEKWLGKMFIDQAEMLKNVDEKRFNWIYLGEVIGIEGLIYNPDLIEYVEPDYIDKNKIRIIYIDTSMDSGHQTSATTCGCFRIWF